MPNSKSKLVERLNELIQLDFDAIEAYQAAIERVDSRAYRDQLTSYLTDHVRHTRNLAERVVLLGGAPSRGPDFKRYLTKGKVVIADLVGNDPAILTAMRINEEVTNKRYEAALAEDGVDEATQAILRSNLEDERAHRAWISAQLDSE